MNVLGLVVVWCYFVYLVVEGEFGGGVVVLGGF